MLAQTFAQAFANVSIWQLLLVAGVALFASVLGGVAGYGTGALMPLVLVPMVGASGAVSGLMGALFRLMFAAQDPSSRWLLREHPEEAPALSLRETFTNRSALTAIAAWVLVNFIAAFGLGTFGTPGAVAWEAHLGGFFTGLLAFDLFDRTRSRPAPASPPSH